MAQGARSVTTEVVERPLAAQQEAVQLLLNLEAAGALTETSLTLDPATTYDQAVAVGVFFGSVRRRSAFWTGDMLNFIEDHFPDEFAQAAHETGLSEQTCLRDTFVCRQIPPERRVAGVAFGAHALVARRPPREQTEWLKRTASKGWGETELRAAMRAKRKDERPPLFEDVPVLVEVARLILADARPHEADDTLVVLPAVDLSKLEAALADV